MKYTTLRSFIVIGLLLNVLSDVSGTNVLSDFSPEDWYRMESNNPCMAVSDSGYVATSDDGGNSWQLRSSTGNASLYSIQNSGWRMPSYDGFLWMALNENGSVATSTTNGANWILQSSIGNGSLNSIQSFAPWPSLSYNGDGEWIALSSSGYVATSTNNGANWMLRSSTGNGSLNSIYSSHWYMISCCNGDTIEVQSVSFHGSVWIASGSRIDATDLAATSTNGGLTWTLLGN